MEEKIITVEKLQEKLNNHENVFILDVRQTDQRKEWRIEGSRHIDAYKQLNAGDDTALDQLEVPHNTTVVTVCAAGRTSLLASNLLQRKGIQAYSLQGGMKAWNYAWNIAEVTLSNKIKVVQVRRTAKGVLSYVVGSSGEALVIDAALDPKVYQQIAEQNGWIIKYVADTHIHADYVSRTRDLAKATGAKHLMIDTAKVDFDHLSVGEDQFIKFGNASIQFLHTPGHTWESTTLKIGDDVVFTGDTLFIDGIGRPDLKAGKSEAVEKAKALYRSLQKLRLLGPDILVLPAHTSNAISFDRKLIGNTIGNIIPQIAVADLTESAFVTNVLSNIPPTPPNYEAISMINKKGLLEGNVLEDLEAGGNHCAIR